VRAENRKGRPCVEQHKTDHDPKLGGVAAAPRRRRDSNLKAADGVVPEPKGFGIHSCNASALEPPRLRRYGCYRDIFLKAHPPLLTQEGIPSPVGVPAYRLAK